MGVVVVWGPAKVGGSGVAGGPRAARRVLEGLGAVLAEFIESIHPASEFSSNWLNLPVPTCMCVSSISCSLPAAPKNLIWSF